jgi:hypothetical protein
MIGYIIDTIVSLAKERMIDLMILTTGGHTRLKHILLDSIVERGRPQRAMPRAGDTGERAGVCLKNLGSMGGDAGAILAPRR